MVRECHKLSHGPPSPVLLSEPPSQVLRGPGRGGEVGSQWDHPTHQQVQRGGPAGWDPPSPFSSTDIRERVNMERMSSTTLVEMLTRYCHQKPGGLFELPKIASSDYCPLCNQGNTCLGHVCKGKKEPSEKRVVSNFGNLETSCTIPGLPTLTETERSSTVLKSPTLTVTVKNKISALSTNSAIFKPRTVNQSSSHSIGSPNQSTSNRSQTKTSSAIIRTPNTYLENSKLQKKLKYILKSSKYTKRTTKQAKMVQEHSQMTSLFRKLAISEIPCSKLSSPISSNSLPTLPTSISRSSNLPSSANLCLSNSSFLSGQDSFVTSTSHRSNLHSSQFPDHDSSELYSSSSNFAQIVQHLRTEWDMAKSSEIYDIETSDETKEEILPEPEIMRMDSSSSKKRRQSPSPVRERVLTPTKQTPSSPVRGHTPRKSTPKKRAPRLACRNHGCRVNLTSAKGRVKHETDHCKYRDEGADVSMETEYNVPTHEELVLDPNQCRVCEKKFGSEQSRKRHERDQHRFFEQHGRTVSPISLTSNEEMNPSSRPQSCPPPGQEGGSSSGFITPKRPIKRRRALSSSSTPDYTKNLHSSPIRSPHLTLTPSLHSSFESSLSESLVEVNQAN